MGAAGLLQLLNHRQRLANLSVARKLRYVAGVLYGQTFRSRNLGTLGLRVVEISLTDRCQCRCDHCYANSGDVFSAADEMSTDEVRGIIDEMAEMGVMEVSFEGGEPLIRWDLPYLVRHARSRGIVPKINTNGLLLTEENVLRLERAGLAWAMVSIDSAEPALHDRLRHFSGCHARAVEGLHRLRRHRIPTSIVTCVRRSSIHNGDLSAILALGRATGVKTVRVLFPANLGRLAPDDILSLEEREEVRRLLRQPMVTMEHPWESSPCMAGLTRLSISTRGDVTPCSMLPLAFGNVRRQPLREIWEAMGPFARVEKPRGQCPINDPAFRETIYGGDYGPSSGLRAG